MTTQALLVIGAQQCGGIAGRNRLQGMAGTARGNRLLLFHYSQVMTAGTDRGLIPVEERRQFVAVGDIGQLLRNLLVFDLCGLVILFQEGDDQFILQVRREKGGRRRKPDGLVQTFQLSRMTRATLHCCEAPLPELVAAGAIGLGCFPSMTADTTPG